MGSPGNKADGLTLWAMRPTVVVAAVCLGATIASMGLPHWPAVMMGLAMTAIVTFAVHKLVASQAVSARRIEATLHDLRVSEARFRSAFDDAAIGMAIVKPDGGWLRVNRALLQILGYSDTELLDRSFQDITHADDLTADLSQVRAMLAGTIRTYQMEKRYLAKSGAIVWALLSVSLVRDEQGEPLYFISQVQDISARKRMEEELRHVARHDRLTGLPTGSVLHEHLEQCFRRSLRWQDYHFGVLFLDLNGFKQVNDTLGHDAGDEVLRQVSQRLQSGLRASDSIARGAQPMASRLGGDEFVVLLDRLARPEDAHVLAERLTAALAMPYTLTSQTAHCSAAVGVAVSGGEHADAAAMLRAADNAMYAAKRKLRDAA